MARFWSAYDKVSAVLGVFLMGVFFAFVFNGVVSGMMDYFGPNGFPEVPTSIKTRPIIILGVNTPILLGLISFAVIPVTHEGAHEVILKKLGALWKQRHEESNNVGMEIEIENGKIRAKSTNVELRSHVAILRGLDDLLEFDRDYVAKQKPRGESLLGKFLHFLTFFQRQVVQIRPYHEQLEGEGKCKDKKGRYRGDSGESTQRGNKN